MYSSPRSARECRQSPACHDARRLPCEHRPSRSLHRNAGRGTAGRASHDHRAMETRRINSAAHIQGQRTATLYRLRPNKTLGVGNKVLTVKQRTNESPRNTYHRRRTRPRRLPRHLPSRTLRASQPSLLASLLCSHRPRNRRQHLRHPQ